MAILSSRGNHPMGGIWVSETITAGETGNWIPVRADNVGIDGRCASGSIVIEYTSSPIIEGAVVGSVVTLWSKGTLSALQVGSITLAGATAVRIRGTGGAGTNGTIDVRMA